MSGSNVAELQAKQQQSRISKQQLLTPQILEKEVEIPSLGGTIKIRSMSHAVRQEIREQSGYGTEDFNEDRFVLLSIVNSVVDPELTESDLVELVKQSGAVIDEITVQITMLNMLGQAGDLKKESGETPS